MTGATSGLGKVSALEAAKAGAKLLVLARNIEKGTALVHEFKRLYPESKGAVEIFEGDLSSFKSIEEACQKVSQRYPTIDMIVNNAGIMNFERKVTADKVEETWQVNLLSPLLISHLLFNNLSNSIAPKIIFTSSGLHQGVINFDDLEFKDSFSSFKVYRQSKLAVILVCRLLAEKLKENQIGIYSQHPGMVRTELGRSAGWFSKMFFYVMGTSPEKGSETLSYLMNTANDNLTSGAYYAKQVVTKTTAESYDMKVAKQVLAVSKKYLNEYITSESPIFF